MKKILITGGAGYIGSHTSALMLEKNIEIVIIDNFSNSERDVYDRLKEITGKMPQTSELDMTDYSSLYEFWSKNPEIDSVIHFAAYKAVGESVSDPMKYYHNNVLSLINLLQVGQKFGLKNVVFSSSCTVYGQPESLPVTEQSPLVKAESPYGNTKKICEDILYDLIKSQSPLRVISLRYFNPIGAHPTGLLGELPRGVPNNLVPYITQTAAGVRKQLNVFGNDYNTPDGTCIRDFIDVNDLAEAHLAALRYLETLPDKPVFEAYNIGTGVGASVQQLIDTFHEATGIAIPYVYAERRPGDIEKIWADTQLANKTLNWEAKTPLSVTLRNAWKWERHIRMRMEKKEHR